MKTIEQKRLEAEKRLAFAYKVKAEMEAAGVKFFGPNDLRAGLKAPVEASGVYTLKPLLDLVYAKVKPTDTSLVDCEDEIYFFASCVNQVHQLNELIEQIPDEVYKKYSERKQGIDGYFLKVACGDSCKRLSDIFPIFSDPSVPEMIFQSKLIEAVFTRHIHSGKSPLYFESKNHYGQYSVKDLYKLMSRNSLPEWATHIAIPKDRVALFNPNERVFIFAKQSVIDGVTTWVHHPMNRVILQTENTDPTQIDRMIESNRKSLEDCLRTIRTIKDENRIFITINRETHDFDHELFAGLRAIHYTDRPMGHKAGTAT